MKLLDQEEALDMGPPCDAGSRTRRIRWEGTDCLRVALRYAKPRLFRRLLLLPSKEPHLRDFSLPLCSHLRTARAKFCSAQLSSSFVSTYGACMCHCAAADYRLSRCIPISTSLRRWSAWSRHFFEHLTIVWMYEMFYGQGIHFMNNLSKICLLCVRARAHGS